jgi:hypothetical protein
LNFEELGENLGYLKTSICWDSCPLSFILSLSFSEHPNLFFDIWIELVAKGILGALLHNKRG